MEAVNPNVDKNQLYPRKPEMENLDERAKSLPRGRNRFLMEKKGKPSKSPTNDYSWAR